jgi:cytochrome c biogenesis protein CcdA
MGLHLPDKLRKRINTRIRAGRKASAYVWFAFVTGLIISMLELACTGQIYLPTIIFMTSQDSMQIQAIMYLLLYNFMFIVPLIVVFILAFYGTNSSDLTKFLEKHATKIKVGMGILFSALGFWLIYSIFK